MVNRPTVAIGLGGAGSRILSTLHGVLQEEDVDEEKFKFLCLDTKEDEKSDHFPELDDGDFFGMEKPADWDRMTVEYDYLNEGETPGSTGGASRSRPVGRAFVDSDNLDDIYGFLEFRIENYVETHAAENINLWLVNALGGGTGSGSFPIIAAMLDKIVERIDVEFDFLGLGSLPRLNKVDDNFWTTDNPQHYRNAYSSLAELQGLIEHDYTEPLPITIESNPKDIKQSEFRLTRPPFQKYFLLGVGEEETETHLSRERINRIAANTILHMAHTSGIEQYPEEETKDNVLLSIDLCELTFPRGRAEKYVGLDADIDELQSIRRVLNRAIDTGQENKNLLRDASDMQPGSIPDGGSDVPRSLISDCEDEAGTIEFSSDKDYVQTRASELAARADNYPLSATVDLQSHRRTLGLEDDQADDPQESFVSEEVEDRRQEAIDHVEQLADLSEEIDESLVRYFFYDQLADRLTATRKETKSEFEERIDEWWEKLSPAIEDADEYDTRNAETRWEEALRSKMRDKETEFEEKYEESGIGPIGKDETLQKKADALAEARGRINELEGTLEDLQRLKPFVENQRQEHAEAIKDRHREFQDALSSIEMLERDIKRDKESNERTRQNLVEPGRRDSLVEFDKTPQYAELSLSSPEELTASQYRQIVDEWSLGDLVTAGLVERDSLEEELGHVVDKKLTERVMDLRGREPESYLVPMTNTANDEWINYVRGEIQSSQITSVDNVLEEVEIADKLTIRFLGLYTDLDLNATSEYGRIQQARESDEETVSEVLTGTLPEGGEDEIRFAYPALLRERDRVEDDRVEAGIDAKDDD